MGREVLRCKVGVVGARRSRPWHQHLTTAQCMIALISSGPAFWAHGAAQSLAIAVDRGRAPRSIRTRRDPVLRATCCRQEVAMYGSMLPLLTEFMKPDL